MGKGMAYNSGRGRSWFTCAGAARADSDIDLVLLATHPYAFRADTAWLDAIDWTTVGLDRRSGKMRTMDCPKPLRCCASPTDGRN
jgi:hypothetical protein